MARTYAFYFTVALLVMSVYLAESPRVKIAAVRDVPLIIAELESMLTGSVQCGGICRAKSECVSSCPRCAMNPLKGKAYCRAPRASMEDLIDF